MPRLDNTRISPLHITVIGGGTGNSTVLSGLKQWVGPGLSAVVDTFDDGGSTGKIRDEYGGIAVGDLRQCARAMSNLSSDVLACLEGRFEAGSGLSDINVQNQAVGNLVLEKFHQLFKDNPERIISAYSELYNIEGRVLPVCVESCRLNIQMTDGTLLEGEHHIEETKINSLKGSTLGFDKIAYLSNPAKHAISQADMVVIAPGDLYTSIGPNLVVEGMREAIQRAKLVVMVANLMNRDRHTVNFSVLDYVKEYERLLGARFIDKIIYNTAELDKRKLHEQEAMGSQPVIVDKNKLESLGYGVLGMDLLSRELVRVDPNDVLAGSRSSIRHDPDKVAKAIMGIYFDDCR